MFTSHSVKNEKRYRDVPMTERAKEVLVSRVARAQEEKGEYIFPLRIGNGNNWAAPINELEPAHLRALKICKISPPFRRYDMSHTHGTRAVEGGTYLLSLMRT